VSTYFFIKLNAVIAAIANPGGAHSPTGSAPTACCI